MSDPSHPQPTHESIRRRFHADLKQNAGVAAVLLTASLVIGMVGYRVLAPMSWLDAFVNAAMLLGGMGQLDKLDNPAVKIFAGLYALYCGLMFVAMVGLLLAPLGMRLLRRFHLDQGRS